MPRIVGQALRCLVAAAAATVWIGGSAGASDLVVLYQVPESNYRSITVSVDSVSLPPVARGGAVSASGGQLGLQTTDAADRVTASLTEATPSGVTLAVRITSLTCLSPCSGAAGSRVDSYVSLSTSESEIASGIGPVWDADAVAVLSYQLTAGSGAALGGGSSTVTFVFGP